MQVQFIVRAERTRAVYLAQLRRNYRLRALGHLYSHSMIAALGTVFAGLLGLAFGSFLNVCATRWPEDESSAKGRSHCRSCGRKLTWWENIPLVSWIALRGRCRTCKASIGWRYPLVELAVGGLWAFEMFRSFRPELLWTPTLVVDGFWFIFLHGVSQMVLIWFLVALAVLDAEHLWLPDRLTWLGIAMGVLARLSFFVDLMRETALNYGELPEFDPISGLGPVWAWLEPIIAAVLAAALILFIRWLYKLLRRREGLGLGDAKLMAMMGAWLGFPEALLSFVIGVLLASLVAIVLLVIPRAQRQEEWSGMKLPLGTFLCIGGIVSSFWGRPIVVAYLKWSGF